jgi:hypothetical protein
MPELGDGMNRASVESRDRLAGLRADLQRTLELALQ